MRPVAIFPRLADAAPKGDRSCSGYVVADAQPMPRDYDLRVQWLSPIGREADCVKDVGGCAHGDVGRPNPPDFVRQGPPYTKDGVLLPPLLPAGALSVK